ncbi:MAG: TrmH family RNA methyltransferase [Caulobacteraceae bacterium]
MKVVTSLANDTVKAVRALHLRKAREESGLFLAEGLKIVTEAVDLGFSPAILMHGVKAGGQPALARAAAVARETIEVTPAILAKISRRDNPQTVLGVFEQRLTPLTDLKRERVVVALEEVRDPGNLGTIIRTADAAGCGGVILIGETCDPYSVEAVRATMGSIFAVPIARASNSDFLAFRADWPGAVIGTHLAATTDFRAAPYRPASVILFGAEQAGLSDELAAACDAMVKIPMRGRADSLNLAVAAGVMIYAATGALESSAP